MSIERIEIKLELAQDADEVRISGSVAGHDIVGHMPKSTARQLGANLVNLADDVTKVAIKAVVDVDVEPKGGA